MANHPNRGRIAVDLDGAWRLYTNRLPAGAKPLGTVTSSGDTGALALFEATGLYARVNAGSVASLPQRKVAEAIERAASGEITPQHGGARPGAGRKARDSADTARYSVMLDHETHAMAAQLGGGDVSLGLRGMAWRLSGRAARDWATMAPAPA